MIKKIIGFCLLLALPFLGQAQIELNEPVEIKTMVDAWEQNAFSSQTTNGWRIQIGSTNDLRKAEELKADFINYFPDIPIDWIQEYPYYKLRVGAFKQRKDTKPLIQRLRPLYPSAYAAKESKIPVSDFIPSY